ncbi:MAG TPA: GNAT family N-acetyltransferase [Solirubrobacterales bacterium]|nr:GNAT family N-acetyltransferase [Solirubrobacterales bacterium]
MTAGGPARIEARIANADDLEALAEIMARAFSTDPVWGWAFADPLRKLEQQRTVWGFALRSALDYGWVRLTTAGTVAALWIPPGRLELRPEDEERFEPLLAELLGDGAPRVLDTFERFDRARPTEPHYYLSLLATHPDHRGKGLGMGLLAENLALIDAEGAAAYLESTNPANHRRYGGVGFVKFSEFGLAEDGPAVTQMWRQPR